MQGLACALTPRRNGATPVSQGALHVAPLREHLSVFHAQLGHESQHRLDMAVGQAALHAKTLPDREPLLGAFSTCMPTPSCQGHNVHLHKNDMQCMHNLNT